MISSQPLAAETSNPNHRNSINWRFWIPLALVMVFAAGLRLYALGDNPQTFGHDEAQIGYDAWSLWQPIATNPQPMCPSTCVIRIRLR